MDCASRAASTGGSQTPPGAPPPEVGLAAGVVPEGPAHRGYVLLVGAREELLAPQGHGAQEGVVDPPPDLLRAPKEVGQVHRLQRFEAAPQGGLRRLQVLVGGAEAKLAAEPHEAAEARHPPRAA